MNREIKFRAWIHWPDRKTPQMYYSVEREYPLMNLLDKEYVKLMQYTGLKDRNDKEIYEGDILQVADNVKYEIVFLLEDEYEETICAFGLKNSKTAFAIDHFAIKNGEVIGNIYETKEETTTT